ncbi:MAG: PQQ-dependent sugar dehydrogenase [Chloroflexi bacterium]|nr:PQQ-dependent sugar dehydrogenase [Chloroflexota bacterium]
MLRKTLTTLAAIGLLTSLTSCLAQQTSPIPPPAPSPISSPSSPLPTATPRPTPPATTSVSTPVINVETVVTDLNVPWALDSAPDGRIFLTERGGQIRVIENGRLLAEPWLTLEVAVVGEGGLMGLALDPQFAQNHFVYVAFTYRNAQGQLRNRLARLREDPASKKGIFDKILLDGITGGSVHDGGRVKFGPDGKLYLTMGEAGNTQLAQDLTSLNGKILRLNPDGTIPPDNPIPNSPVYSYGHRNPQGLAWQPVTGRLYETEHGPSGLPGGRDELNFIESGKNYGWPVISGDETREGMQPPVQQSGLTETWAPSGMTLVRGGPWDGSLLFVGLRGETLYRVVLDRNNPRQVLSFERLLVGQFGRLRDVVQGPDGAIYILTNNRDGRGQPRAGDDRLLKLTLR